MTNVPVSHKIYQHSGNQAVVDLVPAEARAILDVGCGAGGNARLLRLRGAVVDGVTLSPAEADLARAECRSVWLHDLEDGLPAEATGPYDAVLCSHVLEHLRFADAVLRGARSVLRPGGALVVALPNMLFYRNRLRLLCGQLEYESGGLMDETHFRWYSFASAQRLLARHGFVRDIAVAEGSLPLPGLRRIIPARLLAPLDRLAVRLFPGLFGYQLLYRYTRAPDE